MAIETFALLIISFLFLVSSVQLSNPIMCNGRLCDGSCSNCNICDASNCVAADDCYCPSKSIPGNLPISETPQFIFFTFDDCISKSTYEIYKGFRPLFDNPLIRDSNNCPLKPTIYTQTLYTDYDVVAFFDKIGSVSLHTVEHMTSLTSSYDYWYKEFKYCYDYIHTFALVEKTRGARSPNLIINDNYFDTLKAIKDIAGGSFYDSSSNYYYKYANPNDPENQVAFWPFTLDFGFPEEVMCQNGCPSRPHPGIWEFPMIGYQRTPSIQQVIMDYIISDLNNYAVELQAFKTDFDAIYNKNRAPMGFYFHYSWFMEFGAFSKHKLQFIEELFTWIKNSHSNIVFATEERVIDWMKNPKPYSETKEMSQFKCIDTSYYNARNSCNGKKTSQGCQINQATKWICSEYCPNINPEIDNDWYLIVPESLNNGTNSTNQTKNTTNNTDSTNKTNETANNNATNNTDSNTTDSLINQTNIYHSKMTIVSTSEWSTGMCGKIYFDNPTSLKINLFILSLKLCHASFTYIEGSDTFKTHPNANEYNYKILQKYGNIPPNKKDFAVGFCLTNTNDFDIATDVLMGVDMYPISYLTCTSAACPTVCGDFFCDSKSENEITCPIDCKPKDCSILLTPQRYIGKPSFSLTSKMENDVCISIYIRSPVKKKFQYFVLNMQADKTKILKYYSFWGYQSLQISFKNTWGYKEIGSNLIITDTDVYVGGFCAKVSLDFKLSNHVNIGVDLYDKNLLDPIETVEIHCGNGICDSNEGENTQNCYIDCR